MKNKKDKTEEFIKSIEKSKIELPPMYEFITDYKIKKHKTQWPHDLYARLDKEIKEAKDFRSKVIILHLYIEYWINEIIRISHRNAELIIDDEELGKFGNKIKILKIRGFIDYENLLVNLKQIQEIRNHYSHVLLMKDELDQKIKDKIENMKTLYIRKELDISKKSFEEKFLICAFDTFNFLEKLFDHIIERKSLEY